MRSLLLLFLGEAVALGLGHGQGRKARAERFEIGHHLEHAGQLLFARLGDEGPGMPGMVDIYVISLVILHWTVLLTVAIYAFIVLAMKGPAYVADPYFLDGSKQPLQRQNSNRQMPKNL